MRKMLIHFFIFMVILSVFPVHGVARTGYVSDMLLLTFREGPGNSYKVLKTLKSNTKLDVLDEEENGFYQVELQSKEIGWVDKKFIIFELPSFYIAKNMEAKNKILEAKIKILESTNQNLTDSLDSLKTDYSHKIDALNASIDKAKNENIQLLNSSEENRKKYTVLVEQSKDILKIIQENKDYKKTNQVLTKDLEALENKYKNSFRASMIKWFLAGVAVLLAGWILGSGVSSKRRRSGSLLD